MFLYLIVLKLLSSPVAHAEVSPTIGAQISVAAAQELLASPPLPSLENGGSKSIAPQAGYMVANTSGHEDGETIGSVTIPGYDYKGKIEGGSAGVGFTSPPNGRIGWFGLMIGSYMKGDITINDDTAGTARLKDITSKVLAGAAGISVRVLGESKSMFAVGLFAGPAFMKVESSFTVVNTGINDRYKLNPLMYGPYGGLQAKLRLGNFLINPYVLYFDDLKRKCKKFDEMPNNQNLQCESETNAEKRGGGTDLDATFTAYGVFLGYKRLRLNVYSNALRAKEFDEIDMTTYSLSYAFGVDL